MTKKKRICPNTGEPAEVHTEGWLWTTHPVCSECGKDLGRVPIRHFHYLNGDENLIRND